MAILNQDKNQVEVRIRREPEGSYFDEFVKIEGAPPPNVQTCEHYIVGEPGITYSIEVTLKAGYDFGKCKAVKAWLHTHGRNNAVAEAGFIERTTTTGDLKRILSKTNLLIEGQRLKGASLTFKELNIADHKFIERVGTIQPHDLGTFLVEVQRILWIVTITDEMRAALVKPQTEEQMQFDQSALINPTTVDEDTYSKGGITSAIKFVGGAVNEDQPYKKFALTDKRESLYFRFHCRSSEFLDRPNIVPYPPSLHLFAWKLLNQNERQQALKALQTINQEHVCNALDDYGRKRPKPGRFWKEGDPLEWRAWSNMNIKEREIAFEKLQRANQDFAPGNIQKESREIQPERKSAEEDTVKVKLEPVDDGPGPALITPASVEVAIPAARDSLVEADRMNIDAPGQQLQLELSTAAKAGPIEISDDEEPPAKRPKVEPAKKLTTIKVEPIEIYDDEPPVKKAKVEPGKKTTTVKMEPIEIEDKESRAKRSGIQGAIKVEEEDELEKLQAEKRKLAKEIEEEERLRSMKRKHEALLENIEAARARKAAE